jgi:hypothetical protein
MCLPHNFHGIHKKGISNPIISRVVLFAPKDFPLLLVIDVNKFFGHCSVPINVADSPM